MARDGIANALQMKPMQPMQPGAAYGGGASTGPGYGPMGRMDPIMQPQYQGKFAGMEDRFGQNDLAWGNGYSRQPGLGANWMGENEVSMNGWRPMGFMGPQSMWGGNGGWGSHMGMPTARPIAAPSGYGSDSDAHGSSMGYGNAGGGLW